MKQISFFLFASLLSITLLAQHTPKGLALNTIAPEFSAQDQAGKKISLKQELKKGAVVLVFYRGQWCPYCNRSLQQLEDSLPLMRAKNARVLAITPEKTENIVTTIRKTKASYSILHDAGLEIMKKYDVAFSVDEPTIETYKKYGINFTVANGEKNGANLPVPAVYVINTEGKIIYRFFDTDYKKRSSVKAILEHL